jgi:hypothetical protein
MLTNACYHVVAATRHQPQPNASLLGQSGIVPSISRLRTFSSLTSLWVALTKPGFAMPAGLMRTLFVAN